VGRKRIEQKKLIGCADRSAIDIIG